MRSTHLIVKLETFWRHAENRRKVFEGIAREQGLDPLVANNWYEIAPSVIFGAKVNLFIYFIVIS
jgi:hypothetical protein